MTTVDAASTFEALYRHAPCGLLSLSLSHEITDANETLANWIGVESTALLGRPFTDLLDKGSRVFYETRHLPVLMLEHEAREVAITMVRADGTSVPVLINSVLDLDGGDAVGVRLAVFDATARQEYERDLLQARRAAERSELHVRVLQDISSAYDLTTTPTDLAEICVRVAREAFAARDVAVFLRDSFGMLELTAGSNPLFGTVPPVEELRATTVPVVVTVEEAEAKYPQLAAGFRAERIEAMSVTPLQYEGERLGILVCCFSRRREFDEQFFDLNRALGRQATQALVRVRLQQRLEQLAHYDALTGVPNRALLQERLDNAIIDADEREHPLSLIFIDLDEFKSVNDRLGHVAGDRVLVEVASRLRAGVRGEDVVGRMGGDEFVAICENADLEAASSIAERLRAVIRDPIGGFAQPLSITASIGVVAYQPGIDERPSNDLLLNRADTAMYASKRGGKDKVTLDA